MKALKLITLLHVINECYMDIDCVSINTDNEMETGLKQFFRIVQQASYYSKRVSSSLENICFNFFVFSFNYVPPK